MANTLRRRMERRGLPVHKEARGWSLEQNIGITIDEDYVCRTVEAKTKEVVLATEALALQTWASPKVVEKLMGSWAWIMLLARPAFAIPHQVYRWLHSSSDMKTPGSSGRP